jgi:hypothetical protein
MSKRRQRFREIFSEEVTKIASERMMIPGYRAALSDSLFKMLDREKMRIDHDANAGGIQSEIKEIVTALGKFIEEAS